MPPEKAKNKDEPEVVVEPPKSFIATPNGVVDVSLLDRIPSRLFRNAWRLEGTTITVDLEAARDIRKQQLREARAPLLLQVDADRARALDMDDKAALTAIASRAQALRDVTKDSKLLSANTVEDLAKVWPEVLGEKQK